MKAFQLKNANGINGLVLRTDLDQPEPGPDEVLVRVRAASLNFRDFLVAHNQYPVGLKPSVIPLSDGAGDAIAVGKNVKTVKVGDRVAGSVFPDWISGPLTEEIFKRSLGGPIDGMLAEYVALPERAAIPFPPSLNYEEAACLPNAGVTAWHALVEAGRIRAGQTVLLLGTGGVSLFALQFAKMHSAIVIQTSSSDEKLDRARAMGADYLINYQTTKDWSSEVLNLTDGRGVDIVMEVGGAHTLETISQGSAIRRHYRVNRAGFRLWKDRSPAANDALDTPARHPRWLLRNVSRHESGHCGFAFTTGHFPGISFRARYLCLSPSASGPFRQDRYYCLIIDIAASLLNIEQPFELLSRYIP